MVNQTVARGLRTAACRAFPHRAGGALRHRAAMLLRVAVWWLENSPLLRRLLWRWWYGRLAQQFQQRDWTFMNYGFARDEGAPTLRLDAADEPDRLCIQLYAETASVPLADREVIEIGSGRGGGASYLARTHRPRRYLGVDFSASAVALCRKLHAGVAGLEFAPGDAENLALPDASCDVVVNVESSHCYGHIDRFFREVARVLRPGGHFCYTDFRTVADMAKLEAALTATPGLRVVERAEITARVLAALRADDARKRRLIDDLVPPRLRHLFGEFAGLSDGQIFRGFESGELIYCRFVVRKD
ncbi:MAG: class I SAM-dependent methyltransferase [Opitutus sp.]|nr:class I SAM-dependent methyltransferase [Opitutus sp.]